MINSRRRRGFSLFIPFLVAIRLFQSLSFRFFIAYRSPFQTDDVKECNEHTFRIGVRTCMT